jgi:hypothetical protein
MGVLHEMQDDGSGKFKKGYAMTRQQVKENFKNPHVQRAFTLIDYDTLSPELRAGCEILDEFFGKYSDYTERVMREKIREREQEREKEHEIIMREREMIMRERIEGEVAEKLEKELEQERKKIHEELLLNMAKVMLDNHISDEVILANTSLSHQDLLELKKK